MKPYTADFETVTWLEDETYVWAWALCNVNDIEDLKIGTNIDEFMEEAKKLKNATLFFHNLKFDGEFIIYWCETHGFKHVTKKEDIEDKTYTTLINDMGQFYSIEVYYKKTKKKSEKITFYDSLKLIQMSVKEIAETFGLEESKLEIDYNEERERGHILTVEERDYIKNDVVIVAKALKVLFDEKLTKMTRASNALNDYKEILSRDKFNHYFPVLDRLVDEDLRPAYKRRFYIS